MLARQLMDVVRSEATVGWVGRQHLESLTVQADPPGRSMASAKKKLASSIKPMPGLLPHYLFDSSKHPIELKWDGREGLVLVSPVVQPK